MSEPTSPRSLDQLLSRARGGDGDSLGILLTNYRDYLRMLARMQIHRRLQGKGDPSDLVQEVFLEAHRNFGNFRGQSVNEFGSWLREILATSLAMHVRRFMGTQMRDLTLEQSMTADLDHSCHGIDNLLLANLTSPSQNAARNESHLALAKAIEGLPADYRRVIEMRHLDGRTFPEISAAMERSVDSVEKLWVRGLRALKTEMESHRG